MKMFAKILCLIMALAMMVSCFAACGDDKKEETKGGASVSDKEDKNDKVDIDDEDEEDEDEEDESSSSKDPEDLILGEWSGKADMSESIGTDSKAIVKVNIEFKKDGTYVLEFNKKDYKKVMLEAMEAALDEQGYTEEKFEEESGMTLEEYVEDTMKTVELSGEGEYEIDGDVITIEGEDGEYEFSGKNKLTIDCNGLVMDLKRD